MYLKSTGTHEISPVNLEGSQYPKVRSDVSPLLAVAK